MIEEIDQIISKAGKLDCIGLSCEDFIQFKREFSSLLGKRLSDINIIYNGVTVKQAEFIPS